MREIRGRTKEQARLPPAAFRLRAKKYSLPPFIDFLSFYYALNAPSPIPHRHLPSPRIKLDRAKSAITAAYTISNSHRHETIYHKH